MDSFVAVWTNPISARAASWLKQTGKTPSERSPASPEMLETVLQRSRVICWTAKPCSLHANLLKRWAAPCLKAARPGSIMMFRTWRDRQSVGEGKRVSVRVDLGGRRTIKKKKK